MIEVLERKKNKLVIVEKTYIKGILTLMLFTVLFCIPIFNILLFWGLRKMTLKGFKIKGMSFGRYFNLWSKYEIRIPKRKKHRRNKNGKKMS